MKSRRRAPISRSFEPTALTTMANLRELRLKHKAAFTAYRRSVQELSETSPGNLPTDAVLRTEAKNFDELLAVRRALLEALQAQAGRKRKSDA